MLRTGSEHLKRLQDGRTVYIGSERVDDVPSHRARMSCVLRGLASRGVSG
jgi:aromatic ring hydroxylase